MLLFIFESIGTSELILIGIIALIFLGPRRLPEIAKKVGKIMAEFRGTANEFKDTWKREVDFEEEAKAFDINAIDAEAKPVKRVESLSVSESTTTPAEPAIKEVDAEKLEKLKAAAEQQTTENSDAPVPTADSANDKQNWL